MDELFKMMEAQIKITGSTCWACRPCTAYAHGITRRMKEIEGKLDTVEKKVEENSKDVKGLSKKVEKVEEEMKKKDDKVEQAVREAEFRMSEEMREREARKKNIVLHAVGEDRNEKSTGKDRQEWDRKSCYNVFRAMGITVNEDAVRFCRRVGEKKGEPRPLVCGFWDEMDRNKVIRNARKLEGTDFATVSVCPDLTKKQREEEADMRKEADRRNEEDLTDDDLTKNLRWAAVGDRGQKFLVKTMAREQRGRGGGRWRGGEGRMITEKQTLSTGARPKNNLRGMIRGGIYQRETRAKTISQRKETEDTTEKEGSSESEGEETEVETDPEMEVEGVGKKRKDRSPGGEEEAPPEKR